MFIVFLTKAITLTKLMLWTVKPLKIIVYVLFEYAFHTISMKYWNIFIMHLIHLFTVYLDIDLFKHLIQVFV